MDTCHRGHCCLALVASTRRLLNRRLPSHDQVDRAVRTLTRFHPLLEVGEVSNVAIDASSDSFDREGRIGLEVWLREEITVKILIWALGEVATQDVG